MQLRNSYHFLHIDELERKRKLLLRQGSSCAILGTILLAREGMNISMYGKPEDLDAFQDFVEKLFSTTKLHPFITEFEESQPAPFGKFKVKIKPELIKLDEDEAMNLSDSRQCYQTGIPVEPKDWNQLILDPKTLVIDTRNNYEYGLGHFQNATNPNTSFFSEFSQYLKDSGLEEQKERTIAMYCTGGIRCEKASYYMNSLRFTSVYQLRGGILNYFDSIPREESLWVGACFVFDDRIAIEQDMRQTHRKPDQFPETLPSTCPSENRHLQYIHKKIHACLERSPDTNTVTDTATDTVTNTATDTVTDTATPSQQ